MNKLVFALIASAAGFATVSAAHAEGAYVGGAVTANRYKFDVPNVSSGSDDSSHKAGGKVFAGYEFNPTWAVEGGYNDFGSKGYSYVANGAAGRIDTDSHAFYLAGKATKPLNNQVAVFGKLGVARTHDGISGSGAAAGVGGDSRTGLYASVGAQYAINEKVSLTAEVERVGHSSDYGRKSTGLALGARYNF